MNVLSLKETTKLFFSIHKLERLNKNASETVPDEVKPNVILMDMKSKSREFKL